MAGVGGGAEAGNLHLAEWGVPVPELDPTRSARHPEGYSLRGAELYAPEEQASCQRAVDVTSTALYGGRCHIDRFARGGDCVAGGLGFGYQDDVFLVVEVGGSDLAGQQAAGGWGGAVDG